MAETLEVAVVMGLAVDNCCTSGRSCGGCVIGTDGLVRLVHVGTPWH